MSQTYGFLGENKMGGGQTPFHNFETLFHTKKSTTLGHFDVFGIFVFLIFCDHNQKCLKRSVTPENKGEGGWGQTPNGKSPLEINIGHLMSSLTECLIEFSVEFLVLLANHPTHP